MNAAITRAARQWPLRRRHFSWPARSAAGLSRGFAFCLLTLAGMVPLLAVAVIVVEAQDLFRAAIGESSQGPALTAGVGITPVVLILCGLLGVRWLANFTRRLAGQWCAVRIVSPYRPAPADASILSRLQWLGTDPATWRDMLWLAVNAVAGWLLVAVPVALVLYGIGFAVLPAAGVPVARLPYLGHIVLTGAAALPLGLALALAGLWAAPRLLPAYGSLARAFLGPTRRAELAAQVRHLTTTRSDTIDAGAAELRRIERDLHDGAQARLVAMGMPLDAISQHLDANPDLARELLDEAKQSSVKALSDLRDLVRGIHPPVLADRGLAEAVRALALDSALPAQVTADLSGRPPAPVESGAYFAVSELLANVSKHAGPCRAWIDIRHSGGMLRISVTDDGSGGADPARGSGLRGIERRLAVFDGVLAVSSPPGGPTAVNLEIPCALSSPKTSSC
jgi:signal transduction histidine kinase